MFTTLIYSLYSMFISLLKISVSIDYILYCLYLDFVDNTNGIIYPNVIIIMII